MANYALRFQIEALEQLDRFALLACQGYNLGNRDDWFGAFRGGCIALKARLYGVAIHYKQLHAWLPPRVLNREEIEYQLASVFFHMDSAIECLIFALNALGYAAQRELFCDITTYQGLRSISPFNVIKPSQVSYSGYRTIYPTTQQHWHDNSRLLRFVVDQHDVSKHRETLFRTGMARDDPPPGFFERLGLAERAEERHMFAPFAWFGLSPNPKAPIHMRGQIDSRTYDEENRLETVAPQFCTFMNETLSRALRDARANIHLAQVEFLK